MRGSWLPAVVFTLSALQAACIDAFPASADPQPIIGGFPSPDDDAVAMLVSYPPDQSAWFTCTSVLVAPTVLLTAAHCIDEPNHPGYEYGVFFGADASATPTLAAILPSLVPVAGVTVHPAYDPAPPFTADLGIVELAAPAPAAIAPVPLNRDPVTATWVGTPARIIGYGQQVYGVFNLSRNQAMTVVAGLDPGDTVRVGDPTHYTCIGDSGGPALVDVAGVETILGIDSYTDTTGCTEPAHYRRLDLYLDFIDAFLPPAGTDAGVGPGSDAGTDPGTDAGEVPPPRRGCAVLALAGESTGLPGSVAVIGCVLLAGAWLRRRRAKRR